MTSLQKCIVWLVLVTLSSCTDLLAVYKHDLLLVRDVENLHPATPMSWDSLVLKLPFNLTFPVGLTCDHDTNTLFVAEAAPNEAHVSQGVVLQDAKIFSISLDDQYKVTSMFTAVRGTHRTVIEGMSYDARTNQLFWTEVTTHSIFKAKLSKHFEPKVEREVPEPELLHNLGDVIEPRGMAVDTCKESLYWSERGGSGMTPSSVEMCDLKGDQHKVLHQTLKPSEYYQGLTYDSERASLILGITSGDNPTNSSCRFLNQSVTGDDFPMPENLLHVDSCYPFSLTVEQDVIYWADWARGGIMRATAGDPRSVVKLVDTPAHKNENGHFYRGTYGVALINKKPYNLPRCMDKGVVSQNVPAKIVEVKSSLAEGLNLGVGPQTSNKEMLVEKSEPLMNDEALLKETEFKQEIKENNNAKENVFETIRKSNDRNHSEIKGTGNSNPDLASSPKQPQFSTVQPEETNDMVQSSKLCGERELIVVVGILGGVCVLLLASTVTLLTKLYCRRRPARGCKTVLTSEGTQASLTQPRQVKRFGPKKRFNSGGKSGLAGGSACSVGSGGDGVSINIEDCCQMTLCDTPCYTSVKKEGKTYRGSSRGTNRCEDKRGLLDNCEEI